MKSGIFLRLLWPHPPFSEPTIVMAHETSLFIDPIQPNQKFLCGSLDLFHRRVLFAIISSAAKNWISYYSKEYKLEEVNPQNLHFHCPFTKGR
jgi:hypothetical protein